MNSMAHCMLCKTHYTVEAKKERKALVSIQFHLHIQGCGESASKIKAESGNGLNQTVRMADVLSKSLLERTETNTWQKRKRQHTHFSHVY